MFFASGGVPSGQSADGLHMVALGKEIEGLYRVYGVIDAQDGQIPRQGGGIAGDIEQPLGREIQNASQ